MSASEEIQPSQRDPDANHEEMFEEDEDVSTTTYPSSFHLERPSPARFQRKPPKNDDDVDADEDDTNRNEEGPRALQPHQRRRPTPPNSLDVVASSTGSLHAKKQPHLRNPAASTLMKKRAKKENIEMWGDECGADDTAILPETTQDRVRDVKEVLERVKEIVDRRRGMVPATPAIHRRSADLGRKSTRMDVDDYDEGHDEPPRPPPLKTSTPKKKPLLKRPPLKRQPPPRYDLDDSEEQMDEDGLQEDNDGLLSTSCNIPSLANYALNAPLHTPQFLESGDAERSCEANSIGVGYGEYRNYQSAVHNLTQISVFTPHFYNVLL